MSSLDVVSTVEAAGHFDTDLEVLRGVTGWERILDAIPGAVLLVSPAGMIVHANQTLCHLTGYSPTDLQGRAVELLVPEEQRLAHFASRTAYQRHPHPRPMGAGIDIVCRRSDGSTFPADVRLAPLPLDGSVYVLATLADETERRRREDELFHQSVHDALTGLPNRVLLLDRMHQAFARARRQRSRVSVFYIDLDGFKEVNDMWGHGLGDQVLHTVAQRLSAAVRPADTVARFGGDEFVVLCEALSANGTAEVAARLLEAVSIPIDHPSGTARLTASIGIASSTGARTRPETLIETADHAMYRAKRAGGGRFRRETRK